MKFLIGPRTHIIVIYVDHPQYYYNNSNNNNIQYDKGKPWQSKN